LQLVEVSGRGAILMLSQLSEQELSELGFYEILLECVREQEVREKRLMQFIEELSITDLPGFYGPDIRDIENPPLWRMVNFKTVKDARKSTARNFRRNSWHRPRSRLWSGERKREA